MTGPTDPAELFEVAPCGLALLGPDYTIVAANHYFDGLAGLEPGETTEGRKFPSLLSAAGRIFAMTRLQQQLALTGAVEELVLDVATPGGGRVPVMLNAAQDVGPDGRPGRIRLAVWRAAAKRAYEAEVPKARQAAADAARVKADFLANISHELRTPLNAVVGAAGVLASRTAEPQQRELVEMIQSSAELSVRLLSDILEVSKVQAGELSLDPHPFHLTPALSSALEFSRLQAVEKGLAFEVHNEIGAGALFQGDAVRVRQILAALLSNAVRFTLAGTVRVAVRAPEEGGVVLAVQDTGPGIEAADLERLFEPFEQADTSNSRAAGGAGLGLALTRGLVELMGGKVTVRSAPGAGSTFTVALPLQAVESIDALVEAAADSVDGPPLRVLLVEDNPTNRRVVELILSACGVDLAMAENGAVGVAAWQADRFDLVLMDLQMPVMDGLTAIREIRRMETELARARTPIVVLSANAMAHHQREAKEAGADLHLAKPITPQALVGGMETALAAA